MNKNYQLTFYTSELNQYNYILKNEDIKSQISIFLLKYVSLEAFYKKLLIAEKEKSGKKEIAGAPAPAPTRVEAHSRRSRSVGENLTYKLKA